MIFIPVARIAAETGTYLIVPDPHEGTVFPDESLYFLCEGIGGSPSRGTCDDQCFLHSFLHEVACTAMP